VDSGQAISHTYAAVGTYTATVTATNSVGSVSASVIVSITATAAPISGLAATSDTPTTLGEATRFTATVSSGTSVSYSWDFGDGNTGSGVHPTHVYTQTGTYTATATATNGEGPAQATTIVSVIQTNQAIVGLSASNDGPTQLGNLTVLEANIAAGTNVSYEWDFGDGGAGTGKAVSHSYATEGTFTAVVTATNNEGTETATTEVVVSDDDLPITGLAVANDGPTELGEATLFEATVAGGSNINYAWDFGDGTTGNGATASHTYTQTGIYTSRVTATNGTGQDTLTTEVEVILTEQAITGLTASNNGPNILGWPTELRADVSGGTSVTFTWDFGDGNTGVGSLANHTYAAANTYTATVVATNGLGSERAQTTITILDEIADSGDFQRFLPVIQK
jgi:PKD repeat protein